MFMSHIKISFWLILIAGILALFSGIYLIIGGAYGASGSFAVVFDGPIIGVMHALVGVVLVIVATLTGRHRKMAGILAIVGAVLFKLVATLVTDGLWLLPLIGGILALTQKSDQRASPPTTQV